jgi:hypothetical protein
MKVFLCPKYGSLIRSISAVKITDRINKFIIMQLFEIYFFTELGD